MDEYRCLHQLKAMLDPRGHTTLMSPGCCLKLASDSTISNAAKPNWWAVPVSKLASPLSVEPLACRSAALALPRTCTSQVLVDWTGTASMMSKKVWEGVGVWMPVEYGCLFEAETNFR